MEDIQRAKSLLEVIPRAMLVIRGEMREHAKPELTVPQFRVVGRLSLGAATNMELAEWIGVSAPSMSQLVDLLVQRKLVSRKLGEEDRRSVTIALTKRGRELFDRVAGEVQSKIRERLVPLSPEHKEKLDQGLVILREMFQ